MQESKDYAADPSYASGLGEGDSPSVSVQSSKLRNKLEKLAQWRINPSLITFSRGTHEFRGGFATVEQGLLASSSSAEEVANGSEHITDKRADSDARNLLYPNGIEELEYDRQSRGEGVHSPGTADGDDNHTKEKERTDGEDHKSRIQTSIKRVRDELASSEYTAGGEPESGDRDPQPHSGIQAPKHDQQGHDGSKDSHKADGGNRPSQEEARVESESTNKEQDPDHQTSKPKIVAVKKLMIGEDTDLERVLGLALRESEFLVGLSHPNIIKLEGFVEDLSDHKVWLIFPWGEHGNLRDFVASREWSIPERISLIHDVTLGLEYLHRQEPPIYHGDLKSLNILVGSDCEALITDFGCARYLGNDSDGKQPKENDDKPRPATDPTTGEEHITLEALFSATASTLTLTGCGYTIRWAAPELLQDGKPRLRSDIWALGWIAYEVMTNTIPFHDIKKDAIVIICVIQGQLPSVTEDARMSLIRALCSMMVKCWSIDPQKRPTAEECRKLISWMPMIVPTSPKAIDEQDSQLHYAQLLRRLGNMYKRQADYVTALQAYTEALDIYTKNNDDSGRAATFCDLADVHLFRNEHTEAVTFYSEALQIFTDLGDESDRGDVLWGLAEAYRLQNQFDEAVKSYSESLQIFTNTGRDRSRATALWGLAEVHRVREEYSEAFKLFSEALPIYTDVGDQREIASTLWGLAGVHRVRHEFDKAVKLYSEAIQILIDIGDKHWEVEALLGLAQAHQMQDHHSEAIYFYTKAAEGFEEAGASKRASDAREGAADIRRKIEGTSDGFNGTVDVEKEPM